MPPPTTQLTRLKRLPSLTRNECHFLKVYFSETSRRRILARMANACWKLVLLLELEMPRHATHPLFKSKPYLECLSKNRRVLFNFFKREEDEDETEEDEDEEEDEEEEGEEAEVVEIYKKIVFLARLVEWGFENEPIVANKLMPDYKDLKEPWMKAITEWTEFANLHTLQ
jgi:hypothetical protein